MTLGMVTSDLRSVLETESTFMLNMETEGEGGAIEKLFVLFN